MMNHRRTTMGAPTDADEPARSGRIRGAPAGPYRVGLAALATCNVNPTVDTEDPA